MAYWPSGEDMGWRKVLSILLHLVGIGVLVLALFTSGAYSAIILQ